MKMRLQILYKIVKNKTSEGSNSITIKLLKEVFCYIVKPYTHICNLSFKTGTFPNRMKLAKVIPLFKSGKKIVLTIIDQFRYFLSSRKFLKNFLM